MTNKSLRNHLNDRRGINAMLIVVAIVSGFFTYLGVNSLVEDEDTFGILMPIAFGVAVGVGIWLFWSTAINFMPRIPDPTKRSILCLGIAIGVMVIISVSSWFNASSLAGDPALETHLTRSLEGVKSVVLLTRNNLDNEKRTLEKVITLKRSLDLLVQEEIAHGKLSGEIGYGPVAKMLTGLADRVTDQLEQMQKTHILSENKYRKTQEALEQMQRLVFHDGNVEVRQREYVVAATSLQSLVVEIDNIRMGDRIIALGSDLSSLGTIGNNPKLPDSMASRIASYLSREGELLRAAAEKSIINRIEPKNLSFERLTKPQAIWRYRSAYLPAWWGAIGIDLLPLAILLFVTVGADAVREPFVRKPIEPMFDSQD